MYDTNKYYYLNLQKQINNICPYHLRLKIQLYIRLHNDENIVVIL